MPPNQSPQPSQFPSDYLNQIAAPAQVKTLNPMILWGLIAGVLILAIIVVTTVTSSGGGPSPSSLSAIATKFDALKVVSDDAEKKIQSSELRVINSSLNLSLTNANRDLQEPLKLQEISLKDKKNTSISAVRTEFEELDGRLEDARLNGIYDRTYAREIGYQLTTLRSDMVVLYKKTRSTSLKSALESADANLKPLAEDFSSFNGS